MKKQVLLAGIILLLVTGFSACKKESFQEKSLKEKLVGKWIVNKVDVTTAGGTTGSITYTSSDYLDFKDTKSDDFELSLGTNNRRIGVFTVLADDTSLFLDMSDKDLDSKV